MVSVVRLSRLSLCSTSVLPLSGFREVWNLYDPTTNALQSNFTSGQGDFTNCTVNLNLNVSAGEFIRNVTYTYDSFAVRYIEVKSNLG